MRSRNEGETEMSDMEKLMGRLRELAMRATQGSWHQSYLQPMYVVTTGGPHKTIVSAAEFNEDGSIHSIFADDKSQAGEDVRFIAEASPENILKLLDHIEGGSYGS